MLQSALGILTQRFIKNLHYYCNFKVIIANDPQSPGMCLLHTDTDAAIIWCSPSQKGEATAVPEYEVLGCYCCVARFGINGIKEILAKRCLCMYGDTCGHGG